MVELSCMLQAAKMLVQYLTKRGVPEFTPQRMSTPQGTEYDLYEPKGSIYSSVLMIYGLTYAGEKDPRLVRFASSLNSSGLRVVIPVLPGLKSFAATLGDLERLVDLLHFLPVQYGYPLRAIGFSIGGGLMLVAAGRREIATNLDALLLFDPYYSLQDVLAEHLVVTRPSHSDNNRWQTYVWNQLALAYRFSKHMFLSPDEFKELIHILENYGSAKSQAESFYDRVLQYHQLPQPKYFMPMKTELEQLSPAGQLAHVSARVLIFHDPNYDRMPTSQSQQIIAELNGRSPIIKHKLLITPLLNHVHPQFSMQLFDIFPLLRMFGALYA